MVDGDTHVLRGNACRVVRVHRTNVHVVRANVGAHHTGVLGTQNPSNQEDGPIRDRQENLGNERVEKV